MIVDVFILPSWDEKFPSRTVFGFSDSLAGINSGGCKMFPLGFTEAKLLVSYIVGVNNMTYK